LYTALLCLSNNLKIQ